MPKAQPAVPKAAATGGANRAIRARIRKTYWKLLWQIADEAPVNGQRFAPEIWHELFKRAYIGKDTTVTSEEVGHSTSTLSDALFERYVVRVARFAANWLGVEPRG